MKKILIMVVVFFAGTIIALNSCSSSGKIGGTIEGDTYKTEGWVDDDTFRTSASCAAMTNLTNVVQRKESAKRCATLNAIYAVIEKFVGSKVEGAAGMKNFELTGMAVSQELKAVVKGGSVRNVTYDQDQNAEVIYEVKARGLKKKVSAGEFKAN